MPCRMVSGTAVSSLQDILQIPAKALPTHGHC